MPVELVDIYCKQLLYQYKNLFGLLVSRYGDLPNYAIEKNVRFVKMSSFKRAYFIDNEKTFLVMLQLALSDKIVKFPLISYMKFCMVLASADAVLFNVYIKRSFFRRWYKFRELTVKFRWQAIIADSGTCLREFDQIDYIDKVYNLVIEMNKTEVVSKF